MTTTLRPTTELVAVAWLQSLFSDPMVATTLPKPGADGSISWQSTGFVVPTVVGGSPDLYIPTRNPVIGVDTWAAKLNSQKVPWDLANNIAEEIWASFSVKENFNSELTITKGAVTYPSVKVLEAWSHTEIRRISNDPAGYAHYSFDMGFSWVEI